jgi:hypothetical protein
MTNDQKEMLKKLINSKIKKPAVRVFKMDAKKLVEFILKEQNVVSIKEDDMLPDDRRTIPVNSADAYKKAQEKAATDVLNKPKFAPSGNEHPTMAVTHKDAPIQNDVTIPKAPSKKDAVGKEVEKNAGGYDKEALSQFINTLPPEELMISTSKELAQKFLSQKK